MPSELRRILFQPAEVEIAVREYHRRRKTPLPSGTVVRCGAEGEATSGTVRFRLVVASDPATDPSVGGTGQDVVVEGPALAAALILFCPDKGIPLPASAGKALQRFGDQVGLVVTVSPKPDGAAPAAR